MHDVRVYREKTGNPWVAVVSKNGNNRHYDWTLTDIDGKSVAEGRRFTPRESFDSARKAARRRAASKIE